MMHRLLDFRLTLAGMNKASDWLTKEALKDPGTHRNRREIIMQLMQKSTMFKSIMITPMILSQSDL